MLFNSSQNLIWAVWGILVLWLAIISFFLFRLKNHYNQLTKGTTKGTLTEVLEKILKSLAVSDQEIAKLCARVEKQEKESLTHIQKVGLLRFNPFAEVGSDQSFVLALLDGEDNGIVVTSLTSRTGTRWYGKKVKKATGVEHELSNEEKEALHLAQGSG